MPTSKANPFRALTVAASGVIVVVAVVALVTAPRPQPVQTIEAVLSVPSRLPTLPSLPIPQATKIVPTVPPYVPPTYAMGNCPRDWSQSPDAVVRDTCARVKGTAVVQQQAAERATMQAQPYVQTIPNFTPVVQLPVPEYPTHPANPPYQGWTWHGKEPVGGDKGAWVDPGNTESLHPDVDHGPPKGEHWDWTDPAEVPWLLFPDGRVEPK